MNSPALLIYVFIAFYCVMTEVIACAPGQIFVRAHQVSSYYHSDGTFVSSYYREAYCRDLLQDYEFRNSIKNLPPGIKTKIKPWSKKEKETLDKLLKQIPEWLGRYRLKDLVRGNVAEDNNENPASISLPNRTIFIYDKFFKYKDQKKILVHELAHVAASDFPPEDLKNLFLALGWIYRPGKKPVPPEKVLIPDSKRSPTEDFANHVETYYSDRQRLKNFNPNAYEILKTMIERKEKQK